MNFLLKTIFIFVFVINNRFTQEYAILLKPVYFGIFGLLFYIFLYKLKKLIIYHEDVLPMAILLMNFSFLLLSSIYNSVHIEIFFYGILPYAYILLIYILFCNNTSRDNEVLIVFAEYLIFFNAVICCFQGIYLLFKAGQWQDLITGIHPFGTANELGYVFLVGIVINWFYETPFSNWKNIVYITTMILMEAKGSILLTMIAVIVIKFEHIQNIKKNILVVFVIISIGFGGFYTINKLTSSVRLNIDLVKAFNNELEYHPTASSARLAHLIYVFKHYFSAHNVSPLLGSGLGTYESPAGYFFNSKYLRLKELIFWNKMHNCPQLTHTQIATVLAEGGYLGLFTFEMGLISFIFMFIKQGYRYSTILLMLFFAGQIFHYIFLTFLTFIVFWPTLFAIMGKEREMSEAGSSQIKKA